MATIQKRKKQLLDKSKLWVRYQGQTDYSIHDVEARREHDPEANRKRVETAVGSV